jgi:hypothetical protein
MNAHQEFDAALVAYLPALRRQALYMAGARHEELLQDAVTDMLHLADRCRMGTFRTWAQIILRRSASNFLRAARQAKRAGVCVPDTAAHIAVQPAQEGAATLVRRAWAAGQHPRRQRRPARSHGRHAHRHGARARHLSRSNAPAARIGARSPERQDEDGGMTNVDNVADRPATFDDKLMQYRPGLIKLAGKFTTTAKSATTS